MQMDVVIKTIGRIAGMRLRGRCRASYEEGAGQRRGGIGGRCYRGAGSVINAARHLRVLTVMPKDVGEKYGIKITDILLCVEGCGEDQPDAAARQ